MGQSVIKNPRRVVSFPGGGADPRVDILAANEFKVLYWASVSAASGTITIPTGATILLDQLQGGVDAYPSVITAGQPSGEFPQTSGSVLVTVTSFDTSGNYTLSGTPSAFPVAIVYLLKISALNWSNLTTANILEQEDYNLFINSLRVGSAATPFLSSDSVGVRISPLVTIGAATSGGYSGSYGLYNSRGGTAGHTLERHYVAENNNFGYPVFEARSNGGSGITNMAGRFGTHGNAAATVNLAGTSINLYSGATHIDSTIGAYGSSYDANASIIIGGTPIYNIIGTTSTNYGTRLDATGLRVGQLSTLHTANTVGFEVTTGGCVISSSGNTTLTVGNNYFNVATSGDALTCRSAGVGVKISSGTPASAFVVAGDTYIGSNTLATARLHIDAGTTAKAQIRLASGVAPTTPNGGDIYNNGGTITVQNLTGTNNRMVQADSVGGLTATTEIVEQWLSAGTAATALENVANWTGVNYTGAAITGTYKGQMHFNATYFFIAKADNDWIRMVRA